MLFAMAKALLNAVLMSSRENVLKDSRQEAFESQRSKNVHIGRVRRPHNSNSTSGSRIRRYLEGDTGNQGSDKSKEATRSNEIRKLDIRG